MIRKEKLQELEGYIKEFATIGKTKLDSAPKFLGIERAEYLLKNGTTLVREHLVKSDSDGSAVVILPITKKGTTILVVQPRVLNHNGVGVELPAGYIEEWEEPSVSAVRELVEETGYQAGELIELASYYQDQGCMQAFNHSFLALDCEKVGEQHLDEDEYIHYFECTYDEALELMELGYINDANSILVLEKSKQLIRRRKQ